MVCRRSLRDLVHEVGSSISKRNALNVRGSRPWCLQGPLMMPTSRTQSYIFTGPLGALMKAGQPIRQGNLDWEMETRNHKRTRHQSLFYPEALSCLHENSPSSPFE